MNDYQDLGLQVSKQETNIDLINYKTLVYNGVIYPEYMINFEGTDVYDLKNHIHVNLFLHQGSKYFRLRIPDEYKNYYSSKTKECSLEKARVCTFYDEILKGIDITGAKPLIYDGVECKRYLIFPENKPRILNLNTLRFLKLYKRRKCSKNSTQYWMVSVVVDGKSRNIPAHVATMWTFNGPPPEDMKSPQVDHKDENGLNDDPSNLQWLSRFDNMQKSHSGEKSSNAKINNATVRAFCEDLSRYDLTYTVQELGKKHGLKPHQSRLIYYGQNWKEIVNEFPQFPKRPFCKRKQKVRVNTLF